MTEKNISDALHNVASEYIEEAVNYTAKREKHTWTKWAAVAAGLLIVVMVGILEKDFLSAKLPGDKKSSSFTVVVYATNGEFTELGLHESCFNSAPPQDGNGFGVDMPLFDFSVRPSDLKADEVTLSRFDIAISYNGKVVKDKDEHISVGVQIPVGNSNEPWAYGITGWFAEPTDISITIMDKESREIVETILVNVNYLADQQEYALKITDWNTLVAEQNMAAEANNTLMEYFYRQGYVNEYPAYFGGCYIESNKFYVKLVSPTEAERNALLNLLSKYGEIVVFVSSELSMADLQAYAKHMAEELRTFEYGVVSYYVDSITGDIVIAVLEEDFSAVSFWAAERMVNSATPKIVVKKGEYITLD